MKSNYNARLAIYQALTNGRHLSQMDCAEFEIEDMRTRVSHMQDDFTSAGFTLRKKWIQTPKGRRVKEYWLERA